MKKHTHDKLIERDYKIIDIHEGSEVHTVILRYDLAYLKGMSCL